MKYRLIDIQTTPVTLYGYPQTRKGRVTYHTMRLEPGELYETDDPAQIEYLTHHNEKVRYNKALEDALKERSIPYEVIACKSCGGKVKKIEFSFIEVLRDE